MTWNNVEKRRKYQNAYYHRNRERIREKERLWYRANLQQRREYNRNYKYKLKILVLTYYGKGKCECCICGESRDPCLTIDHIDGNGASHRRSIGMPKGGGNIYGWLRMKAYPEGYQTLCMNCQWIKQDRQKDIKEE